MRIFLTTFLLAGSALTNGGTLPWYECPHEWTAPGCNDGNVMNGYWWQDGWVPGYPDIAKSWYLPAPVVSSGTVVFYNLGAMSATARWRGLDLNGYLGGIAMMSPADISLPVWLKRPGHTWEGPYLVVDAASRGDIYPQIRYRNEVAEVDWNTALRWGMVNADKTVNTWRLDGVQVSKVPPGCVDMYPVTDYPSWWLAHFVPATGFDMRTPVYRPPSTWKINGTWITFTSPMSSCNRPTVPRTVGPGYP